MGSRSLLCPAWAFGWVFLYFHLAGKGLHKVFEFFVCPFVDCEYRQVCRGTGGIESNTTGLEVILASVGQTGTTSVVYALRSLGYRSYHDEEKMCFTPEILLELGSPEEFARPIARCKVAALALEPITDTLPRVLEASPGAKVILTWRDYPSWCVSTLSRRASTDELWGLFVALTSAGLAVSRLVLVVDAFTGIISGMLSKGELTGGAGDATVATFLLRWATGKCRWPPEGNLYERGVFKISAQEEAYLAHMDEIRRLAAGRLLEFDARRHGWPELSRFLGRPEPPGNPAFPNPRTKDSWTNDPMFDHNKRAGMTVLAIGLSVLICKILALRMLVLGLLRLLQRLLRLAMRPFLKTQ